MLQNETVLEWRVSIDTYKSLEKISEVELKIHICSSEDFAQFYPVTVQDAELLQKLKDGQALYCIDDEQELLIRGTGEIDSANLNIDLVPCRSTD